LFQHWLLLKDLARRLHWEICFMFSTDVIYSKSKLSWIYFFLTEPNFLEFTKAGALVNSSCPLGSYL
jgi:hypothetical protein